ncbi:hypothetical protein Tco_1156357 [Tanacetum coccineum]
MSVRLANRSFQYPVGIAENILVKVGKFTFPADFVILEMEEDKEDIDALQTECSKILHSIEGTLLEEEIFAEFDEFMATKLSMKTLTLNPIPKILHSKKSPSILIIKD